MQLFKSVVLSFPKYLYQDSSRLFSFPPFFSHTDLLHNDVFPFFMLQIRCYTLCIRVRCIYDSMCIGFGQLIMLSTSVLWFTYSICFTLSESIRMSISKLEIHYFSTLECTVIYWLINMLNNTPDNKFKIEYINCYCICTKQLIASLYNIILYHKICFMELPSHWQNKIAICFERI